jgi:hypothetical protein
MAIQDILDRINGRIERLRNMCIDTSDSIELVDEIAKQNSSNISWMATDTHKRLVAQDARIESLAQRLEALEAERTITIKIER